jgi:hypothetical protein
MGAAASVDQLHVHPNLLAHAPYAAFEDIADPELAAELLRINDFALKGEGRIAGYHEAVGYPR